MPPSTRLSLSNNSPASPPSVCGFPLTEYESSLLITPSKEETELVSLLAISTEDLIQSYQSNTNGKTVDQENNYNKNNTSWLGHQLLSLISLSFDCGYLHSQSAYFSQLSESLKESVTEGQTEQYFLASYLEDALQQAKKWHIEYRYLEAARKGVKVNEEEEQKARYSDELVVMLLVSRRPLAKDQVLGYALCYVPSFPSFSSSFLFQLFIHPSFRCLGLASFFLSSSLSLFSNLSTTANVCTEHIQLILPRNEHEADSGVKKEQSDLRDVAEKWLKKRSQKTAFLLDGSLLATVTCVQAKQCFEKMFQIHSISSDSPTSSPSCSGLTRLNQPLYVNRWRASPVAGTAFEGWSTSRFINFYKLVQLVSYRHTVSVPIVIAFISLYFSFNRFIWSSIPLFLLLLVSPFILALLFLWRVSYGQVHFVLQTQADPYSLLSVSSFRRAFLHCFPSLDYSFQLFPFMPFGKFTAFISGNVQAYQEILQNPLQTVSRSFMHKQFRTVAGLDGVLFMEGEIHSKHHKVYMKGLNASNRTVPKIVRKYMEEYCANNGRFPWWKSSRSKSVSDQEFIVSSFDGDCLVLATRVWLDIFFGAQSVQTMLENPDSASVLHELMETLMTYDSNNLLTSTKAKSMLVAIFNRVLNALQILKDKYQFEPDSGCLYAEFLKEPRSPQIEHEYEQELVHGWAAHKAIYVVIGFAMNELIFLPHFQAKLQAILSDPADDADSKAEVYLRYLLEETNRIYPISRYNARRAGVPFSVSYDENGQRINPDSGMKAKAALQLTVNTGNEVGLLPTLSNHDSAFWRGALGSIHPFQFETDRWQHLDEMGRKRENAQSAEEEQKEREKDKDYGFSTVTRQLSSRDFITLPALPLPLALRGSSSAAVSADVTYAHIPFLCGRRQCLGKILALRTFISVISVVLGQFWVLPDLENGSQRVVTKGGRFYPSLVNPLVVKFVRRNTSGFATQ